MSGSGIINHPLRDEPGLKTKKVNHHSSEYSSPATHVRQRLLGQRLCDSMHVWVQQRTQLCVPSRHHPVLGKGTDFSSIMKWSQNFLVKFPRLREILGFKISSAGRIRAKISWGNYGRGKFPGKFPRKKRGFFPKNFLTPPTPKFPGKISS